MDDGHGQPGARCRNVGGPLYPPLDAFVGAPLGLLPPRLAYRIAQLLNLLLIFVSGLALVRLSGGRLWWPLAVLLLTAFPGFGGSLNLGQNASLSLALLLWGWVLLCAAARVGRASSGGCWAFKPTWAAAFFLVPLSTGRWRMAGAMVATGAALALATLPFVGVRSWLDWLQVGREASATYAVDQNWIDQSRDLLGVGRRWLLDFDREGDDRGPATGAATVLGWCLLLIVLAVTIGLTRRLRADAANRGASAGVHPAGGAAVLLPLHLLRHAAGRSAGALLFLDLRCYLRPSLLPRPTVPLVLCVLLLVIPNVWYLLPRNWKPPMQIPWDQYLLIALWLWCAGPGSPPPLSGGFRHAVVEKSCAGREPPTRGRRLESVCDADGCLNRLVPPVRPVRLKAGSLSFTQRIGVRLPYGLLCAEILPATVRRREGERKDVFHAAASLP